MCFQVDCKQCGKHSWGGCGKHLSAIYDGIDKGNHCMCRPWPGVTIPTEEKASGQQAPKTLAASSSTTSSAFLIFFGDSRQQKGGVCF
ncbi:hypothetical protein MANES_13G132300v8 [Manihot esculenta]|uniref:Uncharacterized protein n=1 Tax=Manihot esculenta TaxID=3983 RepID=A0ACB7GLX8_MANES|nr:hypothetical protein MANES_13G132300v8 [Manihot esculenta]